MNNDPRNVLYRPKMNKLDDLIFTCLLSWIGIATIFAVVMEIINWIW